MLGLLSGFCAYLASLSGAGELPGFNALAMSDRVLAGSVQAAVERAALHVASTTGASVIYIIHAPKETSPLRLRENLPSVTERRRALHSFLQGGLQLFVLHNPSVATEFYKANLEKYDSICDLVTEESLDSKSGATLFVSFPGGTDPFFYFEINASQVDASSPTPELSIKFGESSDQRILEAAMQRVALLKDIMIERPGHAGEKMSLGEFLSDSGLSFPEVSAPSVSLLQGDEGLSFSSVEAAQERQ